MAGELVIVNYGLGNVGSIANMLKKAGCAAVISGDPDVIARAGRIILPGVGAFDHGMQQLERAGLIPILNHLALEARIPILGICLGMQLLGKRSEEGTLPGLGWIDAESRRFRFPAQETLLPIPQMGWNEVKPVRPHPLFAGAEGDWRFYFVHSYHVCCADPGNSLCTAEYGIPFNAGIVDRNIVGLQFHPEKSHSFGMQLLRNFASWDGSASQDRLPEISRSEGKSGPRLPRVIPCLLLKNGGLVKTVRFDKPKYVGDPINAVKIFNDKGADELAFLDITATPQRRDPDFELIEAIAGEAFMPVAYGGGIRTAEQVRRLVQLGVEKVILNSSTADDPGLIRAAAEQVGRQSVVVSIDVKKGFFGGYEVLTRSGKHRTGRDPIEYAQAAANAGAGEILLTAIDREGTMSGYDVNLLKRVSTAVEIPVIASGGASSVQDFRTAVHEGGAAAVSAGSLFVFHGRHRAVLITYPEREQLEQTF